MEIKKQYYFDRPIAASSLTLVYQGLFVLICLLWIFSGLVGREPWKPDEAYSFGMVWHYIQGGNWVVPTIADAPFMEKPPFFYILASYSAQLFYPWLDYPDGARLTNAPFLALTFIMLGLSAKQLYQREERFKDAFYIAVLLFISCFGLVYRVHLMITDVALLSGFAMSLYALTLLHSRYILAGILLGTGVGLGFMSKGIIAPGIIGSICLSLFLHSCYRQKKIVNAFLIALLTCSPWLLIWPVTLYFYSSDLFVLWFWENNLARFLGATELGPTPAKGFYFTLLPWYAMPVLPLTLYYWWKKSSGFSYRLPVLFAVILSTAILLLTPYHQLYAMPLVFALLLLGYHQGEKQDRFLIPLHYFTVLLAVLSLSSKARELYALPLLLPLALMATAYFEANLPRLDKLLNWMGIILLSMLLIFFWLVWLALVFPGIPVLGEYLSQNRPGFIFEFSFWLFAIALIASLLWWRITWMKYFSSRLVLTWSSGVLAVWVVLSTVLLPYINYGMSYQNMMLAVKERLPEQYDCIMSYDQAEEYRALMHYYVGEKMYEFTDALRQRYCDLLFMRSKYADILSDGWSEIWHGHRPGDHKTFSLYQRTSPEAVLTP
jgi:4-amino-4-deoxy-L-arabinose transferase-like glycosyltransferase